MAEFRAAAVRLAGLAGAVLGWAPDLFWRATPAELAAVIEALTGGEGGDPGVERETLRALMEAFPDG